MLIAEGELPVFDRSTIEDLAEAYIPPDAIMACWARTFSHLSPAHADLCKLVIEAASQCAQATSTPPGAFPYGTYGAAQAETELVKWFGNAERMALFQQLEAATLEYIRVAHPQDGQQRFLITQVHPAYVAVGYLLSTMSTYVTQWIKKHPEMSQVAAVTLVSRTVRALAHHAPLVLPELAELVYIPWDSVAGTISMARETSITESATSHAFERSLLDTSLLTAVRYTVNAQTFLQTMSDGAKQFKSMLACLKELKPSPAEETRVKLAANLHRCEAHLDTSIAALTIAFDDNNMTSRAAEAATLIYKQVQAEAAPQVAPSPVEEEAPVPIVTPVVAPIQEEEEVPKPVAKKRKRPAATEGDEEESAPKRAKPSALRQAFTSELESGIDVNRASTIMVGMGAQILANFPEKQDVLAIRRAILDQLFLNATPKERLEFISTLSTL